jgi:hypothetical protein
LPATESIIPLTRASPAPGTGDVVVEVTVEVEGEAEVDVVVDWPALFDEPQAARDKAATPATERTANRLSRVRLLAQLKAFPQS